nr:ATP-binding protein [Rhizobium ruizarguesonis]
MIVPTKNSPLGHASLLRSPLLFNALFAVQTLLDLVYLWGGADLPDHMSHAEYAHRGAYPLIATALLAAGFILVRDDGTGISEANRQRIFQPFFSTRREQGGTGMGLGIVRAMLSSHGGTIRLLPTTGAGAEFEITILGPS